MEIRMEIMQANHGYVLRDKSTGEVLEILKSCRWVSAKSGTTGKMNSVAIIQFLDNKYNVFVNETASWLCVLPDGTRDDKEFIMIVRPNSYYLEIKYTCICIYEENEHVRVYNVNSGHMSPMIDEDFKKYKTHFVLSCAGNMYQVLDLYSMSIIYLRTDELERLRDIIVYDGKSYGLFFDDKIKGCIGNHLIIRDLADMSLKFSGACKYAWQMHRHDGILTLMIEKTSGEITYNLVDMKDWSLVFKGGIVKLSNMHSDGSYTALDIHGNKRLLFIDIDDNCNVI